MFRFENPIMLYGFFIIPLLIFVFIRSNNWKRKAIRKFGDQNLVESLIPALSKNKGWFRFLYLLIGFSFIILALANPQTGSKQEKVKRKGVDIVIALDVSNSMNARDIRPDRLTAAKQGISGFIEKLHSDRLGLIVFAGEAYVQLPITTDFSAAKMFMNTIEPNIVPVQGTAIGKAIELALNSFDDKPGKNKTIIVITDGEDHDEDAVEWARKASEKNIFVHTIGLGSPSGAPIPVLSNGRDSGFKKDKEGNTVITKLNEDILREIATAGKGIFIRGTTAGIGLKELMNEINKMEQKEFGSMVYTDYEDGYQYFLGAGMLFLIWEIFINDRKRKWMSRLRFWGSRD